MQPTNYELLMQKVELRSEASEALSAIQNNLLKLPSLQLLNLKNPAELYLNQGVINRYLIIEEDFRWLFLNIPIDREKPLSIKEARKASLHINSIYLHTNGVLDNFAWLFLHQLKPKLLDSINPKKVGLFSQEILSIIPEVDEKNTLINYREWQQQMLKKRHPVAHRLPLYIPPQILLSQEELEKKASLEMQQIQNTDNFAKESIKSTKESQYKSIEELVQQNKDIDKRIKKLREKQREIDNEINKLGRFQPGFLYPEENILHPIYPTIPQDLKALDAITNACSNILYEACK